MMPLNKNIVEISKSLVDITHVGGGGEPLLT